MDIYFNNYNFRFVNDSKEKLKYYKCARFIIEDYPYYNKEIYNRVILIDTCYNKNVKNCFKRVKTKRELEYILENIKIGD